MSRASQRREVCCRRIKRIHEVAEQAAGNIQGGFALLACYSEVARIQEDFEAAHLEVIQEMESEKDFEKENRTRALFDELLYGIKVKHYELVKAQQSASNSGSSQIHSKVKLPKIST